MGGIIRKALDESCCVQRGNDALRVLKGTTSFRPWLTKAQGHAVLTASMAYYGTLKASDKKTTLARAIAALCAEAMRDG